MYCTWGYVADEKALIKLLNFTNSVYNFNNNGSETKKSGIKTTYWGGKGCWQVITWSCKPCEARHSTHVNMVTRKTCQFSRHVGTWARKHAKHVRMWARKQDTLPSERKSTQGTLTREHVLSTQGPTPRDEIWFEWKPFSWAWKNIIRFIYLFQLLKR